MRAISKVALAIIVFSGLNVGLVCGWSNGNFNSYLMFDGTLSTLTAYNGAVSLAYDTCFGGSNHFDMHLDG